MTYVQAALQLEKEANVYGTMFKGMSRTLKKQKPKTTEGGWGTTLKNIGKGVAIGSVPTLAIGATMA